MSQAHRDSADSFARVKSVMCELADLPEAERAAAAERSLSDEPELRARVLSMLQGLAENESFLEGELPDIVGADTLSESLREPGASNAAHAPGARIDRYEIVEKLGEGGMAVVYRARQSKPVEREVALKVISAHATDTQRLRFARECATLARLSHPNVAAMFDSGVSNSGEPWVAMELVRGEPITAWCVRHQVPVEDRIRLVLDACRGIAHAHGKGILHRDVKPSNLMVAQFGGVAMVKVIDFGIAAALQPGADHEMQLTGQRLIGTPAYMSPESIFVTDQHALDARSDVYALGVVLFELLCGKRPYDAQHLSLAQWVSRLTSQEAPPMYQLFAQLDEAEQRRIASDAGISHPALKRVLRSDVDFVVRKALSLEPGERYSSSQELGSDLRRYLDGRAVLAHAPNPVYRARKFVRRHWVGVGATALLVVTLISGIVAREMEVRQTRLALDESDAVSEFLVDLLEHASPLRVEEEEVMLQDIIDRGAEQLGERFVEQPAVQARLLHTLGRVYGERGDYARGAELMTQAIEVMDAGEVDDDLERINTLSDLGVALRRLGRTEDAAAVLVEGLALAGPLAGDHPLLVADLANSLGNVHVIRRDWEDAEAQHLRALELREANLPAGDREITASLNNLATVLINSWQLERARPYAERVLEDWSATLPPGHPWLGIAQNNLAIILERTGHKEEALALIHEALDEAGARLGADHPDVADYWRNIAINLSELGRREEAWAAMRRHVGILAQALGPDATRTLRAESRLVAMYFLEGRPDLALEGFESIRRRLEAGSADGLQLATNDLSRLRALLDLGKIEEARAVFEQGRGNMEAHFEPGSGSEFQARRYEAKLIAAEGQLDQAVAMLETQEREARTALSLHAPTRVTILSELARQERARGNYAAAIEWARDALEFWSRNDRQNAVLDTRILLGEICLEAGRVDCAAEYLPSALETFTRIYGPEHPDYPELLASVQRVSAQ